MLGAMTDEQELLGEQADGDQVAWRREGEVADDLDLGPTDTEIYEGEIETARRSAFEELTDLDLRHGETGNPDVAAEEGMAWVPPIDPPVVPSVDQPEGIEIAAGFGVTGMDEGFDDDHRGEAVYDEDDTSARVREAIRADAATSRYAETVAIASVGGRIGLRGVVDDMDDVDNLVDVAGRVNGVDEVVEELEVRALE